jgi:outer membrane lipoprotein carrier protein
MKMTIGFAALFLSLAAPAARVMALSSTQVAEGVQSKYAGLKDLSADFKQESRLATLGRSRHKGGTIDFKKPGKMRWDYEGPDVQLIVSDGRTLWYYRPGQKQVVVQDLGEAFTNQTPLLFLFGEGSLSEVFTWEEKELVADEEERYLLELRPREETPDLVALSLEVRAGDFSVAATVLKDVFGNITRLEFSGEEENLGLDDGLFSFDIPEGAEVIRP